MSQEFIEKLRVRFEENKHRHEAIEWATIIGLLDDEKIAVLKKMEETKGEVDVMLLEGHPVYIDFSKESPRGRRSICYDHEALNQRKKNKPHNSALNMASEIGIELLDEESYRALQAVEPVDLKTSSWIVTPPKIRSLGGALFMDRRYDTIFVYHNGADSYYSARGFRGLLRL